MRVRVSVSLTLCRRRRPRYIRFVFSLCHYRLVLLPSRIFPLPARSAISLFSSRSLHPKPSFALSRHRVAHTLRERQRSEGTGPTEDRKDNVNAALSSLFYQRRISANERRREENRFKFQKQR